VEFSIGEEPRNGTAWAGRCTFDVSPTGNAFDCAGAAELAHVPAYLRASSRGDRDAAPIGGEMTSHPACQKKTELLPYRTALALRAPHMRTESQAIFAVSWAQRAFIVFDDVGH